MGGAMIGVMLFTGLYAQGCGVFRTGTDPSETFDDAPAVPAADAETTAPMPEPTSTPTPAVPTAKTVERDAAWLDEAVADALTFMVQPGTEAEDVTPEEAARVRAFFASHPEYADEEKRWELAAHACGIGLEGAHTFLTHPPPKTAVRQSVDATGWVVAVMHTTDHCTSDDFGWYMAEAQEVARASGALVVWAGPNHDAVELMHDGKVTKRFALTGEAEVTILRDGNEPAFVSYGPGMDSEVRSILAVDAP